MDGSWVGLLVAWLPVWILANGRRRPRLGRVAIAALFVGLVGGICSVELRRYGWLAPATSGSVPPFGFTADEFLRFAMLGGSAALVADRFLDHWGTGRTPR